MHSVKRFLAGLLLLCPARGLAWGPVGHKTVALIAESRLSGPALKAVRELLGPNTGLDAVAVCADEIRGGTKTISCGPSTLRPDPSTAGWHFINIPVTEPPTPLSKYCGAGSCVIDRIRGEIKILEDPSLPKLRRREALIFLVHFVGDEHQPLHCAAELNIDGTSDRGGNMKPVTFRDAPTNLHALWDDMIENEADEEKISPSVLARRLEAALGPRAPSSWTEGNFINDAALESFEIARSTIYPAYHVPGGSRPDANYQSRMRSIVDQRLEMAGVRLAAILNEAFVARSNP